SAQPVYATSRTPPPTGVTALSFPTETATATRVAVTTTNVPTRSQIRMPPERRRSQPALSNPPVGVSRRRPQGAHTSSHAAPSARAASRPAGSSRERSSRLIPHSDCLDRIDPQQPAYRQQRGERPQQHCAADDACPPGQRDVRRRGPRQA